MNRVAPVAVAVSGIAVILGALLIGPMFSPAEFSWLHHSTSEQAGQQLAGAWIMRIGFVAYGLGPLSAAILDWNTRPLVRLALIFFGLGLVSTAVWSNASILPAVSSDMREDLIHSVASGIVGTAFALACAARIFAPSGSMRDVLAWTGLIASMAIPLAMTEFADYRGLLQRAMFAISFLVVIREFSGTDQ